ncbi:MAG: hypothetical protein CML02_07100 [Pseudooceanicola sp.]|jgi:hypothetical protein|nr:hypothetical protein [Pseudooceanicola sp.]
METQHLNRNAGRGLPFRVSLEAVNKAVGLVALGLPFVLLTVSAAGGTCRGIDSISHYYYTRLGGDLLVGSLFLIGTLLAFFYKAPGPVDGYLGHTRRDMIAVRIAGLCAFGVALVPAASSGCEEFAGAVTRLFLSGASGAAALDMAALRDTLGSSDAALIAELAAALETTNASFDFWGTLGVSSTLITKIHYLSALGMFAVLAYYALVVFPRPQSVSALRGAGCTGRKLWRNRLYRTCGGLIVLAILALGYFSFFIQKGCAEGCTWNRLNLTFWFEALALVAFGVSWSAKGRVFSALRDRAEPDPIAEMSASDARGV